MSSGLGASANRCCLILANLCYTDYNILLLQNEVLVGPLHEQHLTFDWLPDKEHERRIRQFENIRREK